MRAQVVQRRVDGQVLTQQLVGGGREQDLPAVPGIEQASKPVEMWAAGVVAGLEDDRSGMHGHTHPNGASRFPSGVTQRALGCQSRVQSCRGSRKGRAEGIPADLEDHSALGSDRLA
jgi:hypothetical protein